MTENRLDRRRARTRAALLGAARELLVFRAPAEVSIQEITDAADVGFGSFYNHFASKQTLFDQAIAEVAAEHQELVRAAVKGLTDPAEALAVAIRLTARFPSTHPGLAKVIDRAGLGYLSFVAPGALEFLRHGHAVGRLCFDDAEVALACAGGAVLGVIRLGLKSDSDPLSSPGSAEGAAVAVLRMFGLVEGDARRVAQRPLPPL
ncbi:AcrR family transcriptional regulator [Actinoplanes lutulentus]|uniref:TetR/AcrR family transcriptional regulator n=1 Tax=Actinoplanes lutulentus TaxID=1287878 RepID=UPI001792A500|nr:TetR/AcrR family transcriptional regulator [Actinoplanes lutulentus]MBB2948922.1 AcrR family transcriptional regulator [Actinoplanes lutulentus]